MRILVCLLVLCCAATAQKARVTRSSPKNTPIVAGARGHDQIVRLEQLTPAERQRALEALPPGQRQKIQNRLNQLEKLTPEERANLQGRLERFNKLPPADQRTVRQMAKELRELPANRRKVVRQELNVLRNMPSAEREAHMTSSEFSSRFSPHEQEILRGSSLVLPSKL